MLLRAALPVAGDIIGLVLAVADGAAVTVLAEGEQPAVAVDTALARILALLQPRSAWTGRADGGLEQVVEADSAVEVPADRPGLAQPHRKRWRSQPASLLVHG